MYFMVLLVWEGMKLMVDAFLLICGCGEFVVVVIGTLVFHVLADPTNLIREDEQRKV